MSDAPETKGRPARLWLLVVVLALAAVGAGYSMHRRPVAGSDPVTVGGGRAQLLDFGMGICSQCKRMKPVMERAARELSDRLDVHVLDLRQEDNERLAESFKMTSIPLIVLVDGAGKELWRHEGFVDFPDLSLAIKQRLGARGGICTPEKERCEP